MDTTDAIDNYREAKEKMAAIINKHMAEAWREIGEEFKTTPVDVWLDIVESQQMEDKYPSGHYAGCRVELGGD